MSRIFFSLFAVLFVLLPPVHGQQPYPNKPLRLIVPYPAAGSTDILGRLIAAKLAIALGEPVTVENRSGAGGNIGADYVAKGPADGYTLLLGGAANAINHTLYKNIPFDFTKDLVPIGMVGVVPNIMVVPNSVPAKTPLEFVAWAKAQTTPVNYASSGNGASTHMTAELFKSATGTTMAHIPYRGSAPALIDLIAGRTQVMFDNIASAMPQIKGGHLRALAVTGPTRSPAMPDLPTLKESGIDVEALSWFCLFVRSGTPKEIVERLNKEVRLIVMQPDVKTKLVDLGADPRDWSTQQLREFSEAEVKKWAKVIQISGAKID